MSNDYLNTLFDLKGKTALVVGGTGELCGAMASGLAQAGVRVLLVGRNAEKAKSKIDSIEQAGGRAEFIQADVSERQGIEKLLEKALDTAGSVDIFINGAGVNSPTPFLEVEDEELDNIMKVNFRALYQACQIFGKYLVDRNEGGNIINVGSMSGVIPLSRVFTYSASKAAVHNLSKNLAREWAPLGIRVNTLVPGFFPAEQNRKVLTEERVGQIMGHTPMKRFGEANELIGATLLLASDKAGSFITGHELIVDGGYASMTI